MKLFCNINIMNNQKSYKIVVCSKKMRNIRGASPAEVAKKVALKLLVKNIYNMYFSIIDIKTNKITHYQSNKKELVRPYHKKGKLVKYRIIVKKMGKQVGGTYQPNLEDENDPIFIFFPKERFDISFHDGKKKYRETDYNKIIYIKDLHNNNCLQIEFNTFTENNERFFCCIELSKLDRCNNKTSDNLEALKKYAKYLKKNFIDNLRYISLIDISCIKDNNVYLSLLSILTTGESWYNRFGFKSDDYDHEIEHNSRIIQMNIMDFISSIIKNIYRIKNYLNETTEKLIEKINDFIEKYDKSKSINDVFIEIKKQLIENRISETDINTIKKILNIASLSQIIIYDINLNYTIPEINS